MKNLCGVIAILIILAPVLTQAQELKFLGPELLNLGKVPGDTLVTSHIRFKNVGDKPLKIRNVRTSCGCTAAELEKMTYAPGEEGDLTVTFNTKGFSGITRKTITFYLEEGTPSPARIVMQAEVYQDIKIDPQYINLQQIPANHEPVKRTLVFTNNMNSPIHVEGAELNNANLKVEPNEFIVKPGLSQILWVTYNTEKPGRHDSVLILKIDSPTKKEKKIPVFISVTE